MNTIKNALGKRLVIPLDVSPTSAIYNLNFCGSFDIDNQPLTKWPIYTYLETIEFPNTILSTIESVSLTTEETCFTTRMKVSKTAGT
jgi:hypothetical protein